MSDNVLISASAIALGSGRVQYHVILDGTGEIKNFVNPPASVEEM